MLQIFFYLFGLNIGYTWKLLLWHLIDVEKVFLNFICIVIPLLPLVFPSVPPLLFHAPFLALVYLLLFPFSLHFIFGRDINNSILFAVIARNSYIWCSYLISNIGVWGINQNSNYSFYMVNLNKQLKPLTMEFFSWFFIILLVFVKYLLQIYKNIVTGSICFN